jgi:hypothetical protein
VEPAATERVDADFVEPSTLQRMEREETSVTGPLVSMSFMSVFCSCSCYVLLAIMVKVGSFDIKIRTVSCPLTNVLPIRGCGAGVDQRGQGVVGLRQRRQGEEDECFHFELNINLYKSIL